MENQYKILIKSQQKGIILELCEVYLNRIKKPQEVLLDYDISLARGAAGIILFLSEVDKVLDISTDEIIFDYIQYVKDSIPAYSCNIGLYVGITGLAYAVNLQNERTGQYKKLLSTLDKIIIDQYNLYHNKMGKNGYVIGTYEEYDVINGLAGLTRYILSRSFYSEQMSEILYLIQDDICRIYREKKENDVVMNGFATHRNLYDEKANRYYWSDDYSYNIGMAHGVPGIISALSLIVLQGKSNQNGEYVLKKLVEFMLEINKKVGKKLLPSEGVIKDKYTTSWKATRCAWCYGNPGIAASMHLAARALKSQRIEDARENLIDNMANNSFSRWMITSPMLCHGYSGVLEILLRIGGFKIIHDFELIDKIIECINYNKKYCFNNNDLGKSKDICGFLDGSTGVALTLLNLISNVDPVWDQVLLIS